MGKRRSREMVPGFAVGKKIEGLEMDHNRKANILLAFGKKKKRVQSIIERDKIKAFSRGPGND